MNKTDQISAAAIGFMLGAFALLVFSFYLFEVKLERIMLLDRTAKEHLIHKVKDTCNPIYPVVRATIYKGRITIECRNN